MEIRLLTRDGYEVIEDKEIEEQVREAVSGYGGDYYIEDVYIEEECVYAIIAWDCGNCCPQQLVFCGHTSE